MNFREWLTTTLGIRCPNCGHEPDFKGGLMGQMVVGRVLDKIKKEGATLTCNKCGHQWEVNPEPQKPSMLDRFKGMFR